MRRTSAILLAGTILLAIIIISIVGFAVRRPEPSSLSAQPIVVAAVSLSLGQTITADKLKLLSTTTAAPADAFLTVSAAVGDGRRSTRRAILADEPVLTSALAEGGAPLGDRGTIRPSMRAVAVAASQASGIDGLLSPGDRVDILLTRIDKWSQTPFIGLLIQNVRILAVGQSVSLNSSPSNPGTTVVLELTPLDAAKVLLAKQVGTLDFAMRGASDEGQISLPMLRVHDLGERPPSPRLVEP